MAKRKVHHNTRTYVTRTEYYSGQERYHTHETRKDARDFAAMQRENKKVFYCRVIPALRGPSNVKRRTRA